MEGVCVFMYVNVVDSRQQANKGLSCWDRTSELQTLMLDRSNRQPGIHVFLFTFLLEFTHFLCSQTSQHWPITSQHSFPQQLLIYYWCHGCFHETCTGHLLWKTHGGSEVVLLSRWKLTLGIFVPPLAPVVCRQSLGRLRARLQSVPAPGNRGPERGWMRRYQRDKQRSALHNPARQGWDKQEGHRGWAGMRKSAVSVRSGAGMPAHMARERNTLGERRGDVRKAKEGTVWPSTCHYIWEDTNRHFGNYFS